MDLAEWYAAGRWVGLIELIDQLPTANRLNEAIANDPESAMVLASMPKSGEKWAPRVSEFDLTATLLQQILHALFAMKQTMVALKGQRPGEIEPFPGPRTEIDKAIAVIERAAAVQLVGLFGFDESDI